MARIYDGRSKTKKTQAQLQKKSYDVKEKLQEEPKETEEKTAIRKLCIT